MKKNIVVLLFFVTLAAGLLLFAGCKTAADTVRETEETEIARLSETYYFLGLVSYLNEDYDKAITDYAETIRLNPDFADAYYSRGRIYEKKGGHRPSPGGLGEGVRD
jgi:tetratricopeptide (TPR) repeat protein